MEERLLIQVVGQVMVYDATARQWHPAGTSSGLSTVRLIHCVTNNTFRIHGQKINEVREVVLDNQITRGIKYNRTNDAFIQWHDSQAFWGLNFRRGTQDAENFFNSVVSIINILNQSPTQQQQQPQQQQQAAPIASNDMTNHNQQQLQQQNSAAIIQRSMQQQQITQPPPQPQQQQAPQQQQQMLQHMLNQQQQPQAMMGQAPPPQMIQQQSQPMMQQQQQQVHQHYMQQQPQSQSLTNQNQMNHYQHPHQAHLQQQQQQQQPPPPPPPPQQQQSQVAAAVSAPIPPPPPPPPAPPAGALNNCRTNGTSNGLNSTNTEAQHSPVTNNNSVDANGGSPSQMSSLASELAKCQLKKVNLSRSDSDKESECNNNNVGNPKTTRAASLAYVPDNLMNDLSKKLASRRERLDQQGDNHSSNNSSNNINGTASDKGHESWLADLIRKEISKEMTRMKAEIIDAIKSELKQR